MVTRCPGATVVGLGLVRGHQVVIDKRGVATIIPARESVECWGVVWEISDANLAVLDRYEGLAGNYYSRELITVEIGSEVVEDVIVYISNSPALFGENPPRPGYLDLILKGARDHELPGSYQDYLASLEKALM